MLAKVQPLWGKFKEGFLKTNNNQVCISYFKAIEPLSLEESENGLIFVLQIPSSFHKKWVQKTLKGPLTAQISSIYKKPCELRFQIKNSVLNLPQPQKQNLEQNKTLFFNPEYKFDSFVVGKHNEIAYEASLAAATKKLTFNPLFIYGPSGLGKTHLLHAIGQRILFENPSYRIKCLSAERFLNDCIQAIRNKKMMEFQKKYRSHLDVLLLDDIQMITKGDFVQEEFFNTFNDLYQQKALVVVCCDKPPHQIPKLEERIKTRLSGGLVVDISYPDIETRLAILKNKANKKSLILSHAALLKIAQVCKKSIREMEGVLNKIKMMSDLLGGGLSFKHIEDVLDTVSCSELTVENIQKQVADKFNLNLNDLKSKSRTKNIVTARQTAMYIIKNHLNKSLSDIGRFFGGRDHTTVLNALRKIEKLKTQDVDFKKTLKELDLAINEMRN